MTYTLKSTSSIPSKGATVNYPSLGKQFLVIHSTADVGATAANEATYFNNNWSKVQAFTQLMVDDKEAYQIYPNGQKSWGAGNVNGYSYSQIEICEFADDTQSKAAIANAVLLAKAVIAEAAAKGISLQVISHHEANLNYNGGTNHTDPDAYFARFGYTMDWFRSQLTTGGKTPATPVKPAVVSGLTVDGYWGASTTKAVQTYLDKIGYKLAVDGSRGPATVKAIQQALNAKLKLKLTVDGSFGPATIKAMQKLLGTTQDGVISSPSQMVKALQTALNSGKQWI